MCFHFVSITYMKHNRAIRWKSYDSVETLTSSQNLEGSATQEASLNFDVHRRGIYIPVIYYEDYDPYRENNCCDGKSVTPSISHLSFLGDAPPLGLLQIKTAYDDHGVRLWMIHPKSKVEGRGSPGQRDPVQHQGGRSRGGRDKRIKNMHLRYHAPQECEVIADSSYPIMRRLKTSLFPKEEAVIAPENETDGFQDLGDVDTAFGDDEIVDDESAQKRADKEQRDLPRANSCDHQLQKDKEDSQDLD
ncbi:hypothetical protein FPCIR_8051 [Fusarium pseudocircinatum]|uniref:Uncharacterized protein n=1 Tax=Fusarium pseudocircinatum TaxID=56676 RepID=A0A8H5L8B9_9HYPO|nr:hypothetical protein FPCIR_8051 [Fusarium pseudocircinatum]